MSLDTAHRTKSLYVAASHGPASHGHDRRPPGQYNASFEGTDSKDGPKWRGILDLFVTGTWSLLCGSSPFHSTQRLNLEDTSGDLDTTNSVFLVFL